MGIDWSTIDAARAKLATPRLSVGLQVEDEVKLVSYDFDDRKRFPKPPTQIELTHLTDLQYGHVNFKQDCFERYRAWILSSPNRFCVLGGDVIDAATVLSIGSPFDNIGEPAKQAKGVCELLRPLVEKGRILGYVGGNHERRTKLTFGDSGALIAERLQIPYSSGVLHIDIRFGQHQPFKLSLWHGHGRAQTDGAKAQMLSRFMSRGDSQVYLVGHLHAALLLWKWQHRRIGTTIKAQKTAGMMSSSFLSYWNSYAEVLGLEPSDTMMGRVILERDGKFEVTMR